VIHFNKRSTVGGLALLAAFSGGCSEQSLPDVPKDSPAVSGAPLNEAPETILSRLSETALMDDPELAPEVTDLWLQERRFPGCFGAEGRAVAQGLERLTYREFLRAEPTTPIDIVDGMVSCLISAGVSRDDAVATAEASLMRGLASFADLNDTLRHTMQLRLGSSPKVLAGTPPPSGAEVSSTTQLGHLRAPGSQDSQAASGLKSHTSPKLPLGRFSTYWLSSLQDPVELDCYSMREHHSQEDQKFVLDGERFIAPLFKIHIGGDREKIPTRDIEVTGILEVWSRAEPRQLLHSEEFSRKELGIRTKYGFMVLPATLRDIREQPEASFDTCVKFQIMETREGVPPASFNSEVWARLDRVQEASGKYFGFMVTSLGPNGRELPYPMVAHWNVIGHLEGITYYKEPRRAAVLQRDEERQRKEGLIGSELRELEMAYVPEMPNATTINIPQSGRAVVIAGATWCGPCRALNPRVKEYVKHLSEVASSTKVFKVSTEDDKAKSGRASDPQFVEEFPSGVLAKQQKKQLGIDAVPCYLVVENGRITKQGILTKDVIDTLQNEQ
jgi:thiol-disulfide isomerase/thioredoxin